MPKHVSNPKGSLMLGYLKDGSDNEHLGMFRSPLLLLQNFSLTVHRSIKNIPWLKILISRMVPCPSNAPKLSLINDISLFVSPHISFLDVLKAHCYNIIQVIGDSGNRSPQFLIKK